MNDTCACGKVRYVSRREARAAAREQRRFGRMSAYQCGASWHLGHLPKNVIKGKADRAWIR